MLSDAKIRICVVADGRATQHWVGRLQDAGFLLAQKFEMDDPSAGGDPHVAIFGLQPEHVRKELARALRKRFPRIRIVMLYDGAIRGTENAHAVIRCNCELDDLARTIRYLANRGEDFASEIAQQA